MSHDEIKFMKLMQSRGFRVTPQRLLILDAVCEGQGHTTFGEIYRRVKELDSTIDQSTIYRTLDVLCEIGIVVSADIGEDGTVYEIAGKPPHHHIVCRECGAVQALNLDDVQTLFDAVQREEGFKVQTNHLVLSGLCRECTP